MKTIQFLIVLTIFLLSNISFSQTNECGTKPLTKAEKQTLPFYKDKWLIVKLEDSLRNLHATKSNKYIEDVAFKIPITVWVYRTINGNQGGGFRLPKTKDIQNLIDEANRVFKNNGTSIRFYLSSINYVNLGVDFTQLQCAPLAESIRTAKTLNLHIVREIEGAGGLTPMYVPYYTSAIFLRREMYASGDSNDLKVFTHETGHYLGLNHTFIYTEGGWIDNRVAEPVTRETFWTIYPFPGYLTPCDHTGDEFCDTPADPNMTKCGSYFDNTWYPNSDPLCYDRYGEQFAPDQTNYMAYGNRPNRSSFSPQQVSWMHSWTNYFYNFTFNNNYFDVYEPDDFKETARELSATEYSNYQSRTLHNRSVNGNTEPDFDFIKFIVDANDAKNAYSIHLRPIPLKQKVNLKIEIRNESDLLIYSGATYSYELNAELPKLSEGNYYIKISPRSYSTSNPACEYGYYGIWVEKCIPYNRCEQYKTISDEVYRTSGINALEFTCYNNTFFNIESGAQVYAKAGKKIVMYPGFKAKAGSFFSAKITDDFSCSDNSNRIEAKFQTVDIHLRESSGKCNENYDNLIKSSNFTNEKQLENNFTIYPNPASNELNVKLNFTEMQNSTELTIYKQKPAKYPKLNRKV